MSKVFSGQTRLVIELDLQTPITDVTEAKIQWEDSQGKRGEWDATITNASTGIIQFAPTEAQDTKPAGKWKVWAKLTYADGKVIYSTASPLDFHTPGTA